MSKGKKQKRKYQADAAKGVPSAETTKLPPAPHPMIESIVVRDVATYAHEGVTFDNLQLINFIYGGNGCGKTTLSRLLASTEPEKDYPNCEIHWTTKPIQTLVYNKDFRDRNLSENIPGVFTLGEQRVEAMQEMDRMQLEAETNGQMAERLARFEGVIMDKFRDQFVKEGNLFQQFQAIQVFCRKHMFMSGDQDDFDSKNELTVPLKVVREAALNLLIHRTWWSEARVPSVNIFDDRVEFMNPGAFPQGTKPEDFRKRPHSEPINEIIANALFKGGVSDGWGRGILDIYELCKEAGLPEPEYDFVQNFVCLTIRFKTPITPYVSGGGELNGQLNGQLNDSQKETLNFIIQHQGCNTTIISRELGKPFRTIDKHVRVLLSLNLIERRGSKKTGGYYPVKQ